LESALKLQHADTRMWLSVNSTSTHPKEFGGEHEVMASEANDAEWVIAGGLFVDEGE
jgi:hypothetical protein